MRVLVASNMEATAEAPQRGSFVRDQVAALRGLGLEVETFDWLPGSRNYAPAVRELRRLLRSSSWSFRRSRPERKRGASERRAPHC